MLLNDHFAHTTSPRNELGAVADRLRHNLRIGTLGDIHHAESRAGLR